MIDKLYWLGYVVVGAGVIYFGGRFIKKYIFRK